MAKQCSLKIVTWKYKSEGSKLEIRWCRREYGDTIEEIGTWTYNVQDRNLEIQ